MTDSVSPNVAKLDELLQRKPVGPGEIDILDTPSLVAAPDPNYRSPLHSDFSTAVMASVRQSIVGSTIEYLHE